jgi:hypothetical protein
MVLETLSSKKTHHKKRTGGVAKGVGPEFKPQYGKKKKKKKRRRKIYIHMPRNKAERSYPKS